MSTGVTAIELHNLSKTYRSGRTRVHALRGIQLSVAADQIYGFLGPNGAGKTTSIRLMLDLIRPTQGEVHIFGQPVRGRPASLAKVGAIVERASFYPFLSGWRNLEILALTGNHDPARIPQLLALTGLSTRAQERVGGYSTGMQQRLGLAAALLGDPDLLILDEPTGGLDPAGIHEMRHYLRAWVDQGGKTVFLSSHILSEVEHICDRVAIIHNGEIVREGSVSTLLSGRRTLRVKAAPARKAAALLEADGVLLDSEALSDEGAPVWLHVSTAPEQAPALLRRLVAEDIAIFEVAPFRQSLESYFLEATRKGGADG
jgi:ABC-2 type transport system ATP-binding protein